MGRKRLTESHLDPNVCRFEWCGSRATQCVSGCTRPSERNPKGNHRRDCPCREAPEAHASNVDQVAGTDALSATAADGVGTGGDSAVVRESLGSDAQQVTGNVATGSDSKHQARDKPHKKVKCPGCFHKFVPKDDYDGKLTASTAGISMIISSHWREALQAYMVGRQVLSLLAQGSEVQVELIEVKYTGESVYRSTAETSIWKTVLNKRVVPEMKGATSKLPEAVRHLVNKEVSALTVMGLMQLHPVIPQDRELLDMNKYPVSFEALVLNSIMLGRLRSQDYIAWMEAFGRTYGRWPFNSAVRSSLYADAAVFVETYTVVSLSRSCDTTLELKPYMRKSKSVEIRNHELIGAIAADGPRLVDAMRKHTFKETVQAGTTITSFGQFVWKNVCTVFATSKQASLFLEVAPWVSEYICRSAETFVGVGTNGAAFVDLSIGSGPEDMYEESGDVDMSKDYTAYYTSLQLFADVADVRVLLKHEDGSMQSVPFSVHAWWNKGWVAQLSACKTLQWLKTLAVGYIGKPRFVKPSSLRGADGLKDFQIKVSALSELENV